MFFRIKNNTGIKKCKDNTQTKEKRQGKWFTRPELRCLCTMGPRTPTDVDGIRRTPMLNTGARHPCTTMHARGRGFCKKRDLAAGLGVMLVGKGRPAGERGGPSPSSSGFLQLVGVLGRDRCARVAAAAGGGGKAGGTRGLLRRVGLLRLNLGQPTVREVGVGPRS